MPGRPSAWPIQWRSCWPGSWAAINHGPPNRSDSFMHWPSSIEWFDNSPLPQERRSLEDLRESLGGFLPLAPFEHGSVHRRSGPRQPLVTRQTWCSRCQNLVIVPAMTGWHSASALYISALKDGLSEDNRE